MNSWRFFDRQRRMHDQHHRQRGDLGDRREILDRIERHLGERGIGGKGEGGDQQRVTVGRCLGDRRRPDAAAGAGTIVDDHGLRPALGEALRHQARDVVGGAARDERNHQLDLLRRIILRGQRRSPTAQPQRQQGPQKPAALRMLRPPQCRAYCSGAITCSLAHSSALHSLEIFQFQNQDLETLSCVYKIATAEKIPTRF